MQDAEKLHGHLESCEHGLNPLNESLQCSTMRSWIHGFWIIGLASQEWCSRQVAVMEPDAEVGAHGTQSLPRLV